MRGWLVIKTTDETRITIGGLDGTGTSDVDLKLVIHSTDDLGPYLRLKASFRMNGVSVYEVSNIYICTLTSAGLENPEEHDVYFDFDKDAMESFVKIPAAGVEAQEEKRRIAEEDETFAKHRKRRGLWVLRVRYLCQNVRSTGFEEAVDMATPAQKAILMNLAQLREVGEFTFVTRSGPAFQRMLKRWEGLMKKLARDAARVSVHLRACTGERNQLMDDAVGFNNGCPPQTVSSAYCHNFRWDHTLSIIISTKACEGHVIKKVLYQERIWLNALDGAWWR